MIGKKKAVDEDFSDFSGGLNTTDPAISISKNQTPYSINAILNKKGFTRVPGLKGLATTPQFSTYLRGLEFYEHLDGTETLLSVSGGIVYSVNITTGVKTQIYDMGGTGEAWMATAQDKCFICNGTKLIKVENTLTGYQVGIAAPAAGATTSAVAGGSLSTGTYKIYLGYARKIGGVNRIYSQGVALADVTLSAGNLTVRISSAPNSADPQVNNKVIWMTDAAGTVYYFYAETGNNTTTQIDISTTGTRNAALNYTVDASQNYVPGSAEYLCHFNNTLFYSVGNVLYWSLKAASVYDYERFHTAANGRIATYPFTIKGMFIMGEHLYLNTVGGIIRLPYGDPVSKYDIVTKNYFIYPRTIREYNGLVYGYTLNGFDVFDGGNFFHLQGVPFDYGANISNELTKMKNGASAEFQPAGIIHKRKDRTEYHLTFRDTDISNDLHNRRLVLDLDGISIVSPKEADLPWEEWEGGAAYFAESKDHTLYCGQSKADGALIYKEQASMADQHIYNKIGNFLTDLTNKQLLVRTRIHIENILAKIWWNKVHTLAKNKKPFTITEYIDDELGRSYGRTFNSTAEVSIFGVARFNQNFFSATKPKLRALPFSFKMKGRAVYLEIEQTEDDNVFEVLTLMLTGIATQNRST